MKVLFLNSNRPDYLAESLFHGIRSLLGKDCVDVPRYDSLYSPLTKNLRAKLRGYGFTLYGLLEDIPELAEARYFWQKDLESYDLIVIAQINFQWRLLWELSSVVEREKILILDGGDSPRLFPYTSFRSLFKHPSSWFVPVSRFKYFKRELMSDVYLYGLERFLPNKLHKWAIAPGKRLLNCLPISFSIPQEKIYQDNGRNRIKDFTQHIVDVEVARHIPGASEQYSFSSEIDYYEDLRKSRFGVTTKRGGWDCMRHYELAANGCVLCFKDLDLKPKSCAPHGLNRKNCIIYHSFADLKEQISKLTDSDYYKLQKMTYEWIGQNTTLERAKYLIECCS